MTESPFSTQGWNRYSYVGNSPLNFTDPSGYCFMGCFWQPIFKAIGNFIRQNWGSFFQIAATAICAATPGCQPFLPIVAGLASAFVTGVTSGDLGQALKAGFISAVTAVAFNVVGDITLGPAHKVAAFGSVKHLANIAGHAVVGCLSAVASGGKCGPGALAAGLSAAASPLIETTFPDPKTNVGSLFGGTAASAVLGGLGSVAGGGKFANGAVTGAFGYLFNAFQHMGKHYVNPWDVGNDAHQTFQRYAARDPDMFYEQWDDDAGTNFRGRPDVGNRLSLELWEIKPNNADAIARGMAQIAWYTMSSTGLSTYSPGGMSIFPGTYPLTLHGYYGAYEYQLVAPGVIVYDFFPYEMTTVSLSFASYFGAYYLFGPGSAFLPLPGGRGRGFAR